MASKKENKQDTSRTARMTATKKKKRENQCQYNHHANAHAPTYARKIIMLPRKYMHQ